MKQHKLTCEKAREISLLDTMAKLGLFPTKKSEKEAWFLSPFRSETQASFKLSLVLNRWYDHGEGIGGNVLDFIIKLKRCSIKEALEFLSQDIGAFSFHQPPQKSSISNEPSYKVLKTQNLLNPSLIRYLESRKIDPRVASVYCTEIHYLLKGKEYYAIGFKNDNGGVELRSKYFKGCFSKKAITTIKNGKLRVVVFEGFMDFLSYQTIYINQSLNEDYIICNSTALAKNVTSKLNSYQEVILCLDNDETGRKTSSFLKQNHSQIIDLSFMYANYNDLNDYLMSKVSER